MRVLIVTSWYPTVRNPVAGVFVQRDAELLAEVHDVEVIHAADPAVLSSADDTTDPSAVRVTRIPMRPSQISDIRAAGSAIAERLRDIDVLHTQAFATLMPFAGRRVRPPWVHTEHWSGIGDPSSLTPRGRAVLSVTGRMLRRPDVVTTVSAHLAERVRFYRRGPIAVVPPPVPPVAPVPPPGDGARTRLVAVGGLVAGKDPMLALETVRELHRRGADVDLTWVGDGPLRSALAAEAMPDDRLTLTGPLGADGVGAALDAADIFLLPTRGETLCLSAVEAITHGRPVVIGSMGGQREYITPANGRLVELRTPEAYADAVLDVRAHRSTMTPDSISASLGGRFDPARVLSLYESAYLRAGAPG